MKLRSIIIIVIVFAIVVAFTLLFDFRQQIYQKSIDISEDRSFYIQKGDSLIQILENMHNEQILQPYQGIAPLHWYIALYIYLAQTSAGQIKAGEYLLKPNMKFRQFLDNAFSGQVLQRKFSIIEGYTLRQILEAMQAVPSINVATTDYSDISDRLGISQPSPEGLIFPDTYYYIKGSDALDLLQQGYDKMQATLAEAWQARDLRIPLTSPYEALILASIVEKEAAIATERPLVAGVFISRLTKNMPLQADPTVIYGLGNRFDGNLRSRDLKEKQPYNSYIYKGLPPTPIAMPSLSSITAVMNPTLSDYLYFVAKGDGSHHFSETYEDHLKAVRKYQLKR
ncbi:MAG: endolytic transglycosylase MltG [Chromatiales bacterium]|nr:endolytic transglycosylase MltG [Chromatiales bacterium]